MREVTLRVEAKKYAKNLGSKCAKDEDLTKSHKKRQ